MTHLLDTNSCVDYLRVGTKSKVAARLDGSVPGSVVLCSVVMAELLYGAHRSNNVAQNLAKVRAFSAPFISLSFDDAAAEEYGKIRAHLEGLGNVIDPNDLMIAATALAHGLILVTHNVGEFGGAPGLVVEDWQTGP